MLKRNPIVKIIILLLVVGLIVGAGYFYYTSTVQPVEPLTQSAICCFTTGQTYTQRRAYAGQDRILTFVEYRSINKAVGTIPIFTASDSGGGKIGLTAEVLLKLQTGKTEEDLQVLLQKYDLTLMQKTLLSDTYLVKINGADTRNILDVLNQLVYEPVIDFAEPNALSL